LISSGLKVTQLINLNRGNYKDVYLSQQAFNLIKRYLNTRTDDNKALFINYRARKSANRRLTARSVERIINKYGRSLRLPFSLTPEILRWALAIALLDKEKKPEVIRKPHTHLCFLVKNYTYNRNTNLRNGLEKEFPLSWHSIEADINKETIWLKNNIPVLPGSYKANPPLLNCDDCILRKIAILIVNGRIKATEYNTRNTQNMWNNLSNNLNIKNKTYHGKQ